MIFVTISFRRCDYWSSFGPPLQGDKLAGIVISAARELRDLRPRNESTEYERYEEGTLHIIIFAVGFRT